MMNNIIYFFIFLMIFTISCVSPPEYSDGLLENKPAIMNESDYFSFSIFGDDFTEYNKWDLNLSLIESDKILSTLIVKDLNINSLDTTHLLLKNEENDTLFYIQIFNEIVSSEIDTILNFGLPNNFSFDANKFSGRIEYQLLKLQ